MLTEVAVNYWAILLCGVAAMVIGFLWYAPFVFGKIWMKEMGWGKEHMDNPPKGIVLRYFISFLAALVMAYIFVHFASYAGAVTIAETMISALWIWIGFIAMAMLSSVLFEMKKLSLFFINSMYYLACLLAYSVIVVLIK